MYNFIEYYLPRSIKLQCVQEVAYMFLTSFMRVRVKITLEVCLLKKVNVHFLTSQYMNNK